MGDRLYGEDSQVREAQINMGRQRNCHQLGDCLSVHFPPPYKTRSYYFKPEI